MRGRTAYILVFSMVSLLAIGIVMLQSTGAFARDSHGDMYHFVRRQGLWLCIGLVAMVGAALTDYRWWGKFWPYLYGLAVLLLVLCFVPLIGMKINGSFRWINLGFASFQPSELGKVAVIVFLAWWFHRHENETKQFLRGFAMPLVVVGVIIGLIALEVDLGASSLIGLTTLAIMFVAGASLLWLAPMMLCGLAGLVYVIIHNPERFARIGAFLDPHESRLGEGLQQWQAMVAFGAGGVSGMGLGSGRLKMLYLPYAHTDFIFPMIGEELGLRFTLLVVFCFLLILFSGVLISMNAKDRFGMLLGFGITIAISLQAAINIGVTTSLLPNKGMPLPFISYGGSNLAVTMLLVGILLNIHRQRRLEPKPHVRAVPATSLAVRF
ncbi:MAG: putative lipid II flippase FtsW [Chthoniobacterales bacterium]|nr:putative lipid II flippase FtsW [Chthoniobacterales bacterium]